MNLRSDERDNLPGPARLAMAVNSHGWEDFPSQLEGDEAAEILSCWTALWHPVLLRNARSIPAWQRIDVLPEEAAGLLLIVPTFSSALLTDELQNRLQDLGGRVWKGRPQRDTLLEELLAEFGEPGRRCEETITRDFLSLGYCYLQIQLMTRQLRYSSSLDEQQFADSVRNAVQLAWSGEAAYSAAMQSCFDQLLEERNRYYPTTANMMDYVLLTTATLGKRLQQTLQQEHAFSLQMPGEVMERIAEKPELRAQIRQKLDAKQLTLAGGEYRELPAALLATWTCARQFERTIPAWRELAGSLETPVYARRTFGLRSALPGLLDQFGIQHAVHSTLDDGVFPQTSGNHLRWEGEDGTTIEALVAPPRLATAPETWLKLGIRIGEVIDMSHYATLLLVHWPGTVCPWYEDAVHSRKFGAILGNFITLDEYFENASDPGYSHRYQADDYRGPWLRQLVNAKVHRPISRFVDYWRGQIQVQAASGLSVIQEALGGSPIDTEQILQWLDDVSQVTETGKSNQLPESAEWIDPNRWQITTARDPQNSQSGILVINPFSFPRRHRLEFADNTIDTSHPSVLAADAGSAIVDLTPMGYAFLKSGTHRAQRGRGGKKVAALAEDVFLRNEYFEVEVDEATGGIGAIKFYAQRGNLMGQQLALRAVGNRASRSGSRDVSYSRMVADEISVTQVSGTHGQITSRGRLRLNDRDVAGFQQITTVERGNPVVHIEIELENTTEISGNPWQDYWCCRFAWEDESTRLFTWQNESRHPVNRQRIRAPLAIDLEHGEFRTTILTGGLPFHQRAGYRRLDTLLKVAGEPCNRFSLGLGVNLDRPLAAAIGLINDPVVMTASSAGLSAEHAWLFHLNCKNVLALYWLPTTDPESGAPGVRVLLKETEGRPADLQVRCFRALSQAFVRNLAGQRQRSLATDDQRVRLEIASHEMVEIELFW